MTFKKGQSGNPSGRPPGRSDSRTAYRDLMRPHAPALVQTAIDMALAGDPQALKLCLDRLVSPIREDAIHVTLPAISTAQDCNTAQAAVLNSVATGQMMPSEGQVLSGLIDAQRRAFETTTIENQLRELREEITNMKGKRL